MSLTNEIYRDPRYPLTFPTNFTAYSQTPETNNTFLLYDGSFNIPRIFYSIPEQFTTSFILSPQGLLLFILQLLFDGVFAFVNNCTLAEIKESPR